MALIDEQDLLCALSQVDGTLTVPAFDAAVTVMRDEWGIPHIRARSTGDAYRALGFVHAQDRLFQMELNLRRAVGRAAEWLGPSAIDSDVLVRRLGMEEACRRDLAALGPDARAMLAAYAEGVNAWIAAASCPPVEYKLLETAPERWQPWHSIAVMRRLGLLMGSVWFKLWRAVALPVVGAEGIAKLRYDDGGRDMLCIPPGAGRGAGTRPAWRPCDRRSPRCWRRWRPARKPAAAATTGRSDPPPAPPDGPSWLAIRIACSKSLACTRSTISPATPST